MKRTVVVMATLLVIVFIGGFLGVGNALTGGTATSQLVEALLVGWLAFPANTLPRTSPDWPSIILGAVAVALFIAGVHLLARRSRPWKLRWSLALVGVLLLLFTAGIAVVGVCHQVGWLVSGASPITVQTAGFGSVSRTMWKNNMMQTVLAALGCHDVYKQFPDGNTFTANGRLLHSWETHLLPYIAYSSSSIDMTIPWSDPKNADKFKGVIPQFINLGLSNEYRRDADGFGLSHLAANSWVLSANRPLKMSDITDGASTTFLLGEVNTNFQPWGHPINWRDPSIGLNGSPHGFGGATKDGVQFAMADGSVRFVRTDVSPHVLRALSTPRDGEKIDEWELPP